MTDLPPAAASAPPRTAHPPASGTAGSGPSRTHHAAGDPALEVRDLTVDHGQLRALSGVSLSVGRGEIHAMIGANGAGKSTLLRTIAGLHRQSAGRVLVEGVDLTWTPTEERVIAGVALVPEGRRLFASLTLEENLLVGGHRSKGGAWSIARVYELFDWMPDRRRQLAAQLSGGEQQAVAIGRALVANPRVLLLDELSLGLSPRVVRQIYAVLPDLVAGGMAVLLVEQDVSQALRVASRIQCLLEGRTVLAGRPGEFTPEQIEAAYFGLAEAASR